MKKLLLILIIPLALYSDNLKSMISYASKHNNLVIAKNFTSESKKAELDAVSRSAYPTIDMGGFYQNTNEKNFGMTGVMSSAYAKIGFDIYDGGVRKAIKKQKRYELISSKFEKDAFAKSLGLSIIQDYFNIKNINSSLNALHQQNRLLKAQLKRVKKFVDASLATNDDIYKLQSAYDMNQYSIESLKFDKLSLLKSLELKVNRKVKNIGNSRFKKMRVKFQIDDNIKALKSKQKAMLAQAKSISNNYNPKIRVEDSYSVYDYGQSDLTHPEGVDNQNKLVVTMNIRVFDNKSIETNKVAILRAKDGLNEQINYNINQQKMLFKLAKSRINTTKKRIKSAKSALKSADSTYEIIEEKYNAGLTDNIAYLDALSQKTNAKALYHSSLNSLEIAYGIYYYYAGKNIRRYIK